MEGSSDDRPWPDQVIDERLLLLHRELRIGEGRPQIGGGLHRLADGEELALDTLQLALCTGEIEYGAGVTADPVVHLGALHLYSFSRSAR
jgi:hypothetical protein